MRIHIVEDDADILRLLEFNLEADGHVVSTSEDGLHGLDSIRRRLPDFVLLDLNLPGMEGLEICRRMKAAEATASIPVIIISVRGRESDIVLGLGMGADDYLTKPFSVAELLARVRAVARRAASPRVTPGEGNVEIGPLSIDPRRHKARLDGEEMTLTVTEFKLLQELASNPGRAYTRDTLKSCAIGDDVLVMDHNIDVHVSAIRRKLGQHREMIETVWGVGYRFHEPAEIVS